MKLFRFCPSCGSGDIHFDGIKQLGCNACSFTFFHNVAAAAAAILQYDGKILFVRRIREPGKGKLDLPGGFTDPNESAEEGLNRELKEELGITLDNIKYLGSAPNVYKYKGVSYNTCDLFFYSKLETLPSEFDKSEINALELIDPLKIKNSEFAFKSTLKGIELLVRHLSDLT
jgi:NAD+ diphosphatase